MICSNVEIVLVPLKQLECPVATKTRKIMCGKVAYMSSRFILKTGCHVLFCIFSLCTCAQCDYFKGVSLSCQKTCHKYLSCQDNKFFVVVVVFNLWRAACPALELACFCHSFCVNVINSNLVYYHYFYYCYYSFQRLTCMDFWHMIKQHYGQELGLTHEDMESLQIPTESSMQTRWPSTQHTLLTGCQH